jgi:exonuclease SbcD
MNEAQRLFLEHLKEVVVERKVEVLLVSGDIFDRGYNPDLEAQELFDEALNELSALVTIIGISGNHDQPRRLSFGAKLFKKNGIHIFTNLAELLEPVVLENGTGRVAFYGIPYLDPSGLNERFIELGLSGADDEIAPTDEGVIRVVSDAIAAHAEAEGYDDVVVLSHAWFVGGEKAGSESETLGGLGPAKIANVSRFTYAALGHLHSPQELAHNVRYSGSPVFYSFTERHKEKSSWLVEIAGGKVAVDRIPVPVYRNLTEITGTVEECISGKYLEFKDDYIKVKLTKLEPNAADKLQSYFPHFLTLEPPKLSTEKVDWESIDAENPVDVCCAAFEFNTGAWPSEEQKDLFAKSFASSVGFDLEEQR